MKQIQDWLASGCPVKEGVRLLEAHSTNKMLIRIVKINPAKNLHLIIKELSSLSNVKPENGGATVVSAPSSSFRDEFPFLSSPDCPMELKALVTDKFSSFYRYRNLHAQLWDCSNIKECADLCRDILDSYLDNRSIYAELDYYKQHRTVLGKHPIFKHYHKMGELRRLSIKELVRKQDQLEHNIWRIESELKKKDKPHLASERQDRLQQKKAELAEVNRLLA